MGEAGFCCCFLEPGPLALESHLVRREAEDPDGRLWK